MDAGTSQPRNCLLSSNVEGGKRLDLFFTNQLYNSPQATDDLIRSIESAHEEALARKALALYQAHYSTLERPWEHVSFMYGLGLIYMHFTAYDWAIKAFREVLYVQPSFERSREIHCRLGLIFKALGRHKLSDKHYKIANHDHRAKKKNTPPPPPPPPTTTTSTAAATPTTNHATTTDNCNSRLVTRTRCEEQNNNNHNTHRPMRFDVNLISDKATPPLRFSSAPPYPPLPSSRLNPSPPSTFVESKKDLTSKNLQEYCLTNTIFVMRNLASVLKMDLGLFSTKTLLETNPDHTVIVQSHISSTTLTSNTNNTSNNYNDQKCATWKHVCQRSTSTIARYAMYQVASFKESLQEEQDSKSNGPKSTKESGTDSNESATPSAKQSNNNSTNHQNAFNNDISQSSAGSQCNTNNHKNSAKKIKKESTAEPKYVKSAHKVDLSEEAKWRAQLHELNKMPNFMKCISACNMLTHLGKAIPGLNTVEMSMHVPGCRVFGRKTESNFCSANLNIGPGNYEWHAVPADHGCVLAKLCNKNGLELEDSIWWPEAEDLQKNSIPVYKFTQRPGDLVWINSGTIYWIHANGWCNNIRWNIGPLCAMQYKAAAESFELDKLIFRKSQVPMIQLTWNIVININVILDNDLFESIVGVLQRSLKYCIQIQDLVQQANQEIKSLCKGPIFGKFCFICDGEVFNIHFVKKTDDWICCVECASRANPSLEEFNIRQDYDFEYLMKLYDNFTETRTRYLAKRQELKQQNHENPSVSQSAGYR